MYFEYRSFSDLNQSIIDNLSIFPHDIDLIVGIPRSGMLPANLLALYLNKPFTDIDSFINGKIYTSGERGMLISNIDYHNILIIDDSILSGHALRKAKKKLGDILQQYNIRFGAIYATTQSAALIDFHCEIIDCDRIFLWNLFHHSGAIPNACFDIDGVLCVNPAVDDDGPIYINYLTNAIPLYVPSVEINTLVTCRLEKYRKITEEWLKRWNIRYKKLIMLDLPNREERIKWGKHGTYKGNIYKNSSCILFVESSLTEATEINQISGKPVFCTETFSMIQNNIAHEKAKYRTKKQIQNIIIRYCPWFYNKLRSFYCKVKKYM